MTVRFKGHGYGVKERRSPVKEGGVARPRSTGKGRGRDGIVAKWRSKLAKGK